MVRLSSIYNDDLLLSFLSFSFFFFFLLFNKDLALGELSSKSTITKKVRLPFNLFLPSVTRFGGFDNEKKKKKEEEKRKKEKNIREKNLEVSFKKQFQGID